MRNISFDNPYLLLIFIPLAALCIVPFIISINKDNGNVGWKISLGIHLVISALVTLAVAGMMSMSVLTKTTVYVLADVSYSSDRNLDEIDAQIEKIRDSLPDNSELGVICFGNTYEVITPAGRRLTSVKEAKVDTTATNIAGALNFAETMFKGNTIKRIVLITDGVDTVTQDNSKIFSTVKRLSENDVKIDAIFLDSTLKEGETEIQISSVEYTKSTYLGHDTNAEFIIQASGTTNVMLELYSRIAAPEGEEPAEYKKVNSAVMTVESGLNMASIQLPTNVSGNFEYKLVAKADKDISPHNNEQTFSQNVAGKLQILLITGENNDVAAVKRTYGERADVHPYVITPQNDDVPFTIEALTAYDEIVLSNLNIRDLNNANAFVDSLDAVVSQYGKSLVVLGDLEVQNSADDMVYKKFAELLPVNYGSSADDSKLYTFVLDISHSMFQASRFTAAKDSIVKLLSVLNDDDYVCLVTFSGDVQVDMLPKKLGSCREELVKMVSDLKTGQGTYIGHGLQAAFDAIDNLKVEEKQVMLISDGVSFTNETEDARAVAARLNESGAIVSTINTLNPHNEEARRFLRDVANSGGGIYYELSNLSMINSLVFSSVASSFTEAIIKTSSAAKIERPKDDVLLGFTALPNVSAYLRNYAKSDAIVPISVAYATAGQSVKYMPLYAYRAHGNGKVAALTTSLSNGWMQLWDNETLSRFASNMFTSLTPAEKVDYPYTINVEHSGFTTSVEIIPTVLNPKAKANLRVIFPNGRATTIAMSFDSQKYFASFTSSAIGSYKLEFTYSYDDNDYVANTNFDIPYLLEYNAFANYDKSNLYAMIKGYGEITDGTTPSLENDENELATYKVSFRVPLLIAAAALFILDILLRKLKWREVTQFVEKIRRKFKKGAKA